MSTIELMAKGVIQAVKDYFAQAIQPYDERIERLERRVSEAEKKGIRIPYRGVYKAGSTYQAGDFATHQGGLWHCNEETNTRPGSGPHWTLAVKSGERP